MRRPSPFGNNNARTFIKVFITIDGKQECIRKFGGTRKAVRAMYEKYNCMTRAEFAATHPYLDSLLRQDDQPCMLTVEYYTEGRMGLCKLQKSNKHRA